MEESLNNTAGSEKENRLNETKTGIDLKKEKAPEKRGSSDDPYMMNGLTLAYIGDAVFELMVRERMIENGSRQVDRLHKHTIALVNAGSQSDMINAIMGELSERELSVFKRGRNSSTVTAAKHQSIGDYRRATGFEALYGYLYLNGEHERLRELFEKCLEAVQEKKYGCS